MKSVAADYDEMSGPGVEVLPTAQVGNPKADWLYVLAFFVAFFAAFFVTFFTIAQPGSIPTSHK